MAMRTFFTLVLAVSCGLASAQYEYEWEDEANSSTTTVPVPVVTPTTAVPVVTPTNTVPVVTPTVSPTVSPSPPAKIGNYTLTNSDNSKEICLRLVVAISVRINYTNSSNVNVSTPLVPLTNKLMINSSDSFCTSNETKAARLHIFSSNDDISESPFSVVFTFTGDKNNWEMGNMTFILDPSSLKNYTASNKTYVEFDTIDQLHKEPNNDIEFTRSYKCDAYQELVFTEVEKITPILNISHLQVQAFDFVNKTTGKFDNARVCLLDTAGTANKIVPIAVGAALAGLVVVVLIAYLIGRLRSRRQSSYEALS